MRFELFIATRYLRAKRRQAVIGVITAISIIGVAAGVTSLIVALSINNAGQIVGYSELPSGALHATLWELPPDNIRRHPDDGRQQCHRIRLQSRPIMTSEALMTA